VFFDPLFLDCHAIGNDLPVDRDELGTVPLNRTCGHSTSAWCQLGNRLRIVNGGSGQWKRLRSRMGHALDDDDDDSAWLSLHGSVIFVLAMVLATAREETSSSAWQSTLFIPGLLAYWLILCQLNWVPHRLKGQ